MTDLQTLIQTRIDLETLRPGLIEAIKRNQTADPALFWRLVALRNDLDAVIADVFHRQMAEGEAA
jgi:hypothetical protein